MLKWSYLSSYIALLFASTPALSDSTGVMAEFSSICLGKLQTIATAQDAAESNGFTAVPEGLRSSLGFADGADQAAYLKPNPHGKGTLLLSLGSNFFEGEPVLVCSLLSATAFPDSERALTDFFGQAANIAFVSNGQKTRSWETRVNGSWSNVILKETGPGMSTIGVIASMAEKN